MLTQLTTAEGIVTHTLQHPGKMAVCPEKERKQCVTTDYTPWPLQAAEWNSSRLLDIQVTYPIAQATPGSLRSRQRTCLPERLISYDQNCLGHPLGVQYVIAAQWRTVRSEGFIVQATPENVRSL